MITYTFEVTPNVSCSAGNAIIREFEAGTATTVKSQKFLLGDNGYIYIDEIAETQTKKKVGRVTDFLLAGKGQKSCKSVREEISTNGYEYTISIDSLDSDGETLHGTLTIDDSKAKNKVFKGYSEEVTKLCEEIVARGVVAESEIDERVKYMAENFVNEDLLKKILKGYRKYNKPIKKPSALYVDPFLKDVRSENKQGKISKGLRSAYHRNAIICEGDKSVGKNVFCETIAWCLNMPLYLITFSRTMSPASVFGEKTTDNSASEILENFSSEWLKKAKKIHKKDNYFAITKGIRYLGNAVMGALRGGEGKFLDFTPEYTEEEEEALTREAEFEKLKAEAATVHIKIEQSELYDWLTDGGVMVFNELNMADSNFLASFANQLLDGTGFLFIQGRGEVPINRDCVLLATQNADYVGVEIQNEATLSRFGCLNFKQPSSIMAQVRARVEAELEKDGYDKSRLNNNWLIKSEKFYKQCKESIESGESTISNACLNIRGICRALVELAEDEDNCESLYDELETHLINTCPTDDRALLSEVLAKCCN